LVASPRETPSEKPLLDKLGVVPGMQVAVIGIDDEQFVQELALRAPIRTDTLGADIVFIAVDGPSDLLRLGQLKEQIARDGAVWTVYRKGRKDFNENDVLRLGLESGLVDVKVVRFSDTHSATKWVIRKNER
jgi:hypothetical protein